MAYLRVLVNPDDDNAFLRIVNTPRREIGPVTLEKLGSYANMRGKSLFETATEMGVRTDIDWPWSRKPASVFWLDCSYLG